MDAVSGLGAGGAAQLQHIAEAARGDERGAGAFLFQDCVGNGGCGVRQQPDGSVRVPDALVDRGSGHRMVDRVDPGPRS